MIGTKAEKKLYDAALTGDATKFLEEASLYADYLEEVTFQHSQNLLHIATKRGLASIAHVLLDMNPEIARSLDSKNSSPLHIAAAKGNIEITKKLLSKAQVMCREMCWSRDCQNMNPIHIAAINGHVEILEELLQIYYLPAMERVHRGQTVLHLCVKHRQPEALKVLVDQLGDLVHAKDDDGETILHWASRSRQLDIIQYLVEDNKIKKDTPNSAGKTALQILGESPPLNTNNYSDIESILSTLRADNHGLNGAWWSKASTMTTIVVAMGMMALQATFNPPGGFWPDDSTHKAGKAVLASVDPVLYGIFVFANMTTFGLCIFIMFHIFIGHTFKIPGIKFHLMVGSTVASYVISILMTIPHADTIVGKVVGIAFMIAIAIALIVALNRLSENDGYALVTNPTPATTMVLPAPETTYTIESHETSYTSTALELGATSSGKRNKSKRLV